MHSSSTIKNMRRWGWLFLFPLLIGCEDKKEGNSYLFLLSFDPLEYYDVDVSGGVSFINLTPAESALTDTHAVPELTKLDPAGPGLDMPANTPPVPDMLDTISTVDLTVNSREAFIDVVDRNMSNCSTTGIFTSVTCSLEGFVIGIGDALKTATDIVDIKITGSNIDDDGVESNTLEGKHFQLNRVSNINADTESDDVRNLVSLGDTLYFNANTTNANSYLMAYDGIAIRRLTNFPGSLEDNSLPLTTFNDQLIIIGNISTTIEKLYRYDGTNFINFLNVNGLATDVVGTFTTFSNSFYVSVAPTAGVFNIYRYDGTNTYQMTQLAESALIRGATSDGVYYHRGGAINALYRLNAAATVPNLRVTPAGFDFTNSLFFTINDKFYFSATNATPGIFIAETAKVQRISDLNIRSVSVYNNIAYMVASDSNLYKFDGTKFERLNPDSIIVSSAPAPSEILATANGVYFVHDPPPAGGNVNEMYRYKSRRFERLHTFNNAVANSTTQRMVEHDGELYFAPAVTGAANHQKLHRLKLFSQ